MGGQQEAGWRPNTLVKLGQAPFQLTLASTTPEQLHFYASHLSTETP